MPASVALCELLRVLSEMRSAWEMPSSCLHSSIPVAGGGGCVGGKKLSVVCYSRNPWERDVLFPLLFINATLSWLLWLCTHFWCQCCGSLGCSPPFCLHSEMPPQMSSFPLRASNFIWQLLQITRAFFSAVTIPLYLTSYSVCHPGLLSGVSRSHAAWSQIYYKAMLIKTTWYFSFLQRSGREIEHHVDIITSFKILTINTLN